MLALLRAGITGGCELFNVGAEQQTLVLCRSICS